MASPYIGTSVKCTSIVQNKDAVSQKGYTKLFLYSVTVNRKESINSELDLKS